MNKHRTRKRGYVKFVSSVGSCLSGNSTVGRSSLEASHRKRLPKPAVYVLVPFTMTPTPATQFSAYASRIPKPFHKGGTPYARCWNMLTDIIEAGMKLACRAKDRVRQQMIDRTDGAIVGASERCFIRIARGISHAITLQIKLEKDPSYSGEPPRKPRPVRPPGPYEPPKRCIEPKPYFRNLPATGPFPSFERVHAGRSVGQIVESIRRRLGIAGPLGDWFEETLAIHRSSIQPQDPQPQATQPQAPQTDPSRPAPPIVFPPRIVRATAMPKPLKAAPPPPDRPPKAPT